MLRALAACGLTRGDIVQNAYGYGLFTGGLGAHYGAEALGATVIPMSGGNTDRQIMVMRDFGVTAICCTPELLPAPAGAGGRTGREHPRPAAARRHLRRRAVDRLPCAAGSRTDGGIRAFDIYGLSEIIGPGVGIECPCQDGLHVFEDHFYPEVIDPDSGEPLPDGEDGELVLTTLSKQAMPMIRYRTRDITRLTADPCPCGRTLRRIARIARRTDDMLIIRGVNVFPSQIEAALLQVEGTLPHYQIILTRQKGLDALEVQVEVTGAFFSDEVRVLEGLQERLVDALDHTLGLRVHVRLVQPRTIERSEGKARRVIDRRES